MLYIIYILIRTRMNPSLAPLPEPGDDDLSFAEKSRYGGALLMLILFGASIAIFIRASFMQTLGTIEEGTWFQTANWLYGC